MFAASVRSYTVLALHLYRNWTSIACLQKLDKYGTCLENRTSMAHVWKLESIARVLKLDKYIAHVPETRQTLHLCRNWTPTAHMCVAQTVSTVTCRDDTSVVRYNFQFWQQLNNLSFQWRQCVLCTSQAVSLCVGVKYLCMCCKAHL